MSVERERIQPLNGRSTAKKKYVLYWMQASQRAWNNPALEHALAQASDLGLPLVVGFGLMDDYPEANARHYAFLLEGLAVTKSELADRGLKLVVRRGAPDEVALELASDAALVVCDRGYLRHQKRWRQRVAEHASVRVEQVEGDVVVPVGLVSQKVEFAARTIRPKINGQVDRFLHRSQPAPVERDSRRMKVPMDCDVSRHRKVLAQLRLDRSIGPVRRFRGGSVEARRLLEEFVTVRVRGYGSSRSNLSEYQVSRLSPYLHFGHVSPVEVALAVKQARGVPAADREAFLEQLIVRRELAINYVHQHACYDAFDGLPDWARRTLADHASDEREHIYTSRRLVAARTHDSHFNAAMREMVHTGYMHNTLRMYWAKKILEWSKSPIDAFRTTLALNNAYFLDGRDPCSYANVAWAFGLHDRPWAERPIFGKVRYMNDRGLERKYDMPAYHDAVEELISRES